MTDLRKAVRKAMAARAIGPAALARATEAAWDGRDPRRSIEPTITRWLKGDDGVSAARAMAMVEGVGLTVAGPHAEMVTAWAREATDAKDTALERLLDLSACEVSTS